MHTDMKIILFIIIQSNCNENIFGFSSKNQNIKGDIWPKPQFERRFNNYLLNPNNFQFVLVGETCDILNEALIRYKKIIRNSVSGPLYTFTKKVSPSQFNLSDILIPSQMIKAISVNLTSLCEYLPYLEMDESYKILGGDHIYANSIWGMLRALETYSQVITPISDEMLQIPNINVIDSPRFPHRGLLLDTARHYINIDIILTILDGMAYNKLNVFHWHIVDDESFPYQSIKYPELSEKGAFSPSMVYTQENISNIIEYARMRGIRVVAEFDVPGHTKSWGSSHPEILTKCFEESFLLGPIYPIRRSIYKFLENFFSEVVNVFPDKYMHLGGDEVNIDCWSLDLTIESFVNSREISIQYLQTVFMKRVAKFLFNNSRIPIVWHDGMNENYEMPKKTIIQVWLENWQYEVDNYTLSGYRILFSYCWYLDHIDKTMEYYYNCEPYEYFDGNPNQMKLIIGGEACMWGENIDDTNVIQKIFPRVSPIAERLWSTRNTSSYQHAQQRLDEHISRMRSRGIPIN